MIAYFDSSAIVKLLLDEKESLVLEEAVAQMWDKGYRIVSSYLAETEVRRAVQKLGISQADVTVLLDKFELVPIEYVHYKKAGMIAISGGEFLRSQDAIHVIVAESLATDVFVTYDKRQASVASARSLLVISPEKRINPFG
ncbi:ribonuclease VapC [Bacteroidia bacterium]|nr:ribonuclease VapC [Bacteroidia bacterium]